MHFINQVNINEGSYGFERKVLIYRPHIFYGNSMLSCRGRQSLHIVGAAGKVTFYAFNGSSFQGQFDKWLQSYGVYKVMAHGDEVAHILVY